MNLKVAQIILMKSVNWIFIWEKGFLCFKFFNDGNNKYEIM